MQKYWKRLISIIDTPMWLEIFFVVLLILRIPSFFEPYYYGDEMIYLSLGEGIRQGVPLYLGLHDNKPPLLYLTAAISGNLFMFKVFLAMANLLSVYLFWKLTKNIFPNKINFQKVATFIFGVASTLPLLEGNIANAENFMIVPTLIAFNLIYLYRNNFKKIFLAGMMFSVASLYKIVAGFDIFGILAFWLIYTNKKDFLKLIKKIFSLGLGFVIPLGFTFVWYYLNGSLNDYITAAFMQNIGYVSSWRPSDVAKPFLEKNLPLLIRFAAMLLGFVVLWIVRKKLSKQFIFITTWLLASLFAVTLSERPYPHYLLQSVAPTSILLAIMFTFKNMEQLFVVIPLALLFFVPFYFKFWHYSSLKYYTNFYNFVFKNQNKEDYFNNFSPNVKETYNLAEFLSKSSSKKDRVFIWSKDSSSVYSLARRLPPTKYVADYHFIDFSNKEDTIKNLATNMPKFIIISPNSVEFNELNDFVYQNYYLIKKENINSQIWISIKN